MKNLFAIAIVQLFLVTPSFGATPSIEGKWLVEKTSCLSGAPVNSAETVSVGDSIQINDKDFEGSEYTLSEDGNKIILTHSMIHDGIEYESGKPPCSKGDKLIIEFSRQ